MNYPPISVNILWQNNTDEEVKLDFADWSINLASGKATPAHLKTIVGPVSDGSNLLQIKINDVDDLVRWQLDTEATDYKLSESSDGGNDWKAMLYHSVLNPMYIFYLEADNNGIVIVGTIETGVDPKELGARPVATSAN